MIKCNFYIEATLENKYPVRNKHDEKQVYCEDAAERMAKVLFNQEGAAV